MQNGSMVTLKTGESVNNVKASAYQTDEEKLAKETELVTIKKNKHRERN